MRGLIASAGCRESDVCWALRAGAACDGAAGSLPFVLLPARPVTVLHVIVRLRLSVVWLRISIVWLRFSIVWLRFSIVRLRFSIVRLRFSVV